MIRLSLLFIAMATLLVGMETATQAQAVVGADIDRSAIALRGVDGKVYALSQMQGNVVVLSFGATWCKPCAWEMTSLEELQREYSAKPVRFFWISIERQEEISDGKLRQYARSHGLSMPVLRDPNRAAYAQFSDRVRVPMMIFFDAQGKFVAPRQMGMSPDTEQYKSRVRGRLDALLRSSVAVTTSQNPQGPQMAQRPRYALRKDQP